MMLEPTSYISLIDALKVIPWQYCYLLISVSMLSRKYAKQCSNLI